MATVQDTTEETPAIARGRALLGLSGTPNTEATTSGVEPSALSEKDQSTRERGRQLLGMAPFVPSTFSPPLAKFGGDPRARAGVPLDTTSGLQTTSPDNFSFLGTAGKLLGLGSNDRSNAALLSSESDQLIFLNQRLDEQGITERARISQGSVIVPRKNPDTGKIEDVVVDEDQFTMRDISDLFGSVAPTILALVALRRGNVGTAVALGQKIIGQPGPAQFAASFSKAVKGFRKPKGDPGLLRRVFGEDFVRDTTKSALGAGAGRVVNDALARQALGVEGEESLFDLGKREALADFVIGGGLGGAFKVGRAAVNTLQAPLARQNIKKANQEFLGAIGRFEEKYGVKFPTTAGELTMSEKLLAYESFVGEQPGGSRLKEVLGARNKVEREVIQSILDDVSPGDIPRSTLSLSADLFEDIDLGRVMTRQNRETVAQTSEKHIREAIDSMTGRQRFENLDDVGALVREGVTTRKKLFDETTASAYGKVNELSRDFKVRFGDRVDFDQLVKLDSIIPTVDSFLKKSQVPKFERFIKTSPVNPATGLSKIEEEVRKVMKVDHDLLNAAGSKWASKIKELSGGIPLETAQRLRREISSDISFGEGLNDETERFLHQLRSGLTKSIEKSAGDLPSGELRDAFVNANAVYAEGMEQFKNPYASKFLTTNQNAKSFVNDAQVVRDLATNPKSYQDAKRFFEGNPEGLAAINRGIIDERIALSSPGGVLDLKTFQSQLNSLPRTTRNDVLGPGGNKLIADVKMAVTAAGSLGKKGKINAEDFVGLMDDVRAGKPVSEMNLSILNAVETQTTLQRSFNTGVRKKLKNADSLEEVDTNKIADMFVDEATEKEVDDLVKHFGTGERRQNLQAETLVNIFEKAQGKLDIDAVQNNVVGDASYDFSATGLANVLTDKKNRAKYAKILGPEIFAALDDMLIIKSRGQFAQSKSGGGSGAGLAKGAQFAKLSQFLTQPRGALATLTRSTQFRVVSSMLSRPALRNLLERTVTLPEGKAILQGIFAASPLINDVVSGLPGQVKKAKAVHEIAEAFGIPLADVAAQVEEEEVPAPEAVTQ